MSNRRLNSITLRGRVIDRSHNNMSDTADHNSITTDSDSNNAPCEKTVADTDILSMLNKIEGNQNVIIKEVLQQMNNLIADMQKSNNFISEENSHLRRDVRELGKRLELTESLVIVLRKQIQLQNDEITDLQTRSMRDNLIFTGIKEGTNENTEATLKEFLKTQMKVPEAAKLTFDRVHRVGNPGGGTRPIVAKLNPSSGKGKILSHGKNLRNKNFRVFEQFPPAVQEKRKRLMPLFKKAKDDPQVRKVSWSVDKLIIDGRIHRASDAPVNIEPVHATAAFEHIEHGVHVNEGGSTFQAHCADIKRVDDIPIVMASLLKDKAIASATHNMFAYCIGNRDGINDDGEHGGARAIMKVLKDNEVTDKIVIVTRWYGGTHIGKKRFEVIEKCTKDLLKI